MAVNEYYVWPVNGNDTTGNGLTHGTAWKTIAKAMSTIIRDTTNGDRVNLSDEGEATVSATFNFGASVTAPFILQGYTATAGDGGIGTISGGGTVSIVDTFADGYILKDLHLHSTGANRIVHVDGWGLFINVWFENTTGNGLVADRFVMCVDCRFNDIGGIGVSAPSGCTIEGCYFQAGSTPTAQFTKAISVDATSFAALVTGNIFVLAPGTIAIDCIGSSANATVYPKQFSRNSVFFTSQSSTNPAMRITNDQGAGVQVLILDNLFENAFLGIDLSAATTRSEAIVGGNSFFSCTTTKSLADTVMDFRNETLSATPFAKNGAATYANRLQYFSPVPSGDVFAPVNSHNAARGAVQVLAAGVETIGNVFNFPMQDNAATTAVDDTSTNNNNATLSSSTTAAIRTTGPNGSVGFALAFNGKRADFTEVTIPLPFTICFWATRADDSQDDNILGHSSLDAVIWLRATPFDGISFNDGNENTSTHLVDTAGWHHYGFVATSDDLEFYLDGVLVAHLDPLTNQVIFDQIAARNDEMDRATLANLKAFNYALNAQQMLAVYQESV